MCEHPDISYTEFPSRIVGGATGDYFVVCDVVSCQWAEFIVTAISNGAAAAATVVVSGNSKPSDLNYVGAANTSMNNDNCARGNSFSVLASTTIPAPMLQWERITNSEKKVFIRINAGNSNSCYVNIRFRIAELKVIPGPATTTHPDRMQDLNKARADAIRQRTGLKQEIQTAEATITARDRARKQDELHGQR